MIWAVLKECMDVGLGVVYVPICLLSETAFWHLLCQARRLSREISCYVQLH